MSMDPSLNSDDVSAVPEVPSSQLPELSIGGVVGTTSDPNYQPTIRGKVDRFGVAMGTGRRKTSVARVRIKEGTGLFIVNGRPLEDYLRVERDRALVMVPIRVAGKIDQVDVSVRVEGGGITGQTGAIILGVARALQGMNPAWHHDLANAGLLTRDDRMVERKKYGFKKARKSFQFSKR
ncbi:MAG: 30S ribosomal protein S9 [Planctomycetia bacterium]